VFNSYLNIFSRLVVSWVLLLGSSAAHADAHAAEAADGTAVEPWSFKLTPSYYATSNQKDATDVNLRANQGSHTVWLGYYRRSSEFEQIRSGYEYTVQLPLVQLVPSLRLATHGFVGGSISAQLGDPIYLLLGLGRTNARDYYNLNFDPNDSLVYGVGTRLVPKSIISLFTVKDNRLHTGQTITHLVWRIAPNDQQRWTIDLSSKHGRASVNEEAVSGQALSLTYDYRNVFVRVARDRKVNFTVEDQNRFSLGLRF